jgi:hypothetical protein
MLLFACVQEIPLTGLLFILIEPRVPCGARTLSRAHLVHIFKTNVPHTPLVFLACAGRGTASCAALDFCGRARVLVPACRTCKGEGRIYASSVHLSSETNISVNAGNKLAKRTGGCQLQGLGRPPASLTFFTWWFEDFESSDLTFRYVVHRPMGTNLQLPKHTDTSKRLATLLRSA